MLPLFVTLNGDGCGFARRGCADRYQIAAARSMNGRGDVHCRCALAAKLLLAFNSASVPGEMLATTKKSPLVLGKRVTQLDRARLRLLEIDPFGHGLERRCAGVHKTIGGCEELNRDGAGG